ncbi:MAG: hypothetical protein WDA28_13230, partial [Castellaniella sp.]
MQITFNFLENKTRISRTVEIDIAADGEIYLSDWHHSDATRFIDSLVARKWPTYLSIDRWISFMEMARHSKINRESISGIRFSW